MMFKPLQEQRLSMRISPVFQIACVALILGACTTSPTGRSQIQLFDEETLSQQGRAAFSQMQKEVPVSDDPSRSRYARCVADAITSAIASTRDWEVTVFASDEVNAFALPGGKIGIYTRLMDKAAKNQDQLAAVMAHEVAHVRAGHSGDRASKSTLLSAGAVGAQLFGVDPGTIQGGLLLAQLGYLMPYGRGDETEADVLGLDYMARAGFNPAQAVDLWVNMGQVGGPAPPEFLSTHPSNQTRINDIRRQLSRVMPLYEQARREGRRPNCG